MSFRLLFVTFRPTCSPVPLLASLSVFLLFHQDLCSVFKFQSVFMVGKLFYLSKVKFFGSEMLSVKSEIQSPISDAYTTSCSVPCKAFSLSLFRVAFRALKVMSEREIFCVTVICCVLNGL
jgi:hypothetical protein